MKFPLFPRALVLLTLALCSSAWGDNPSPDAATKASERAGKAAGNAVKHTTRAIIELVPGVKPAINGIAKQRQNRRQRRADREANAESERKANMRLEFCMSNPCQRVCRTIIEDRLGIPPDCESADVPNDTSTRLSWEAERERTPSSIVDIALLGKVENSNALAQKFLGKRWGLAPPEVQDALVALFIHLGEEPVHSISGLQYNLRGAHWGKAADILEQTYPDDWQVAELSRVLHDMQGK